MPKTDSGTQKAPPRVSSFTASFHDRTVERDFLIFEYGRVGKYLRFFVPFGALLYFLFIIPDHFTFGPGPVFLAVLALRALFVLISLMLLLALRRARSLPRMHWWISAYTALNSLNFIAVIYFYKSGNHYLQAFSVILMVLAIFLIPNRWVLSAAIACLVILSYIALLAAAPGTMTGMELAAVVSYLAITLLLSAFSTLRGDYYKRVQYLTHRDLERSTITDELTGIYNRKKFDEEMTRWIMLSGRYHGPFSLVLMDIDDFKKVNDTHGHRAGDAVLAGISMLIATQIREIDLLARWGGEEFALLLPQTDRTHAAVLADRIRAEIEAHRFPKAGRITCSLGVTEFLPKDTPESLFIRVDGLLYTAKARGKNCVVSG